MKTLLASISLYDPLKWFFTHSSGGGGGGGGGDSLPFSHIPRWSLAFRLSNLLSCSTDFLRDRFYVIRQDTPYSGYFYSFLSFFNFFIRSPQWFFTHSSGGGGGGGGDSLPFSHIPRWSLAFRLSNLLSCSTDFLRDRFYVLRQDTRDSSIGFFPLLHFFGGNGTVGISFILFIRDSLYLNCVKLTLPMPVFSNF